MSSIDYLEGLEVPPDLLDPDRIAGADAVRDMRTTMDDLVRSVKPCRLTPRMRRRLGLIDAVGQYEGSTLCEGFARRQPEVAAAAREPAGNWSLLIALRLGYRLAADAVGLILARTQIGSLIIQRDLTITLGETFALVDRLRADPTISIGVRDVLEARFGYLPPRGKPSLARQAQQAARARRKALDDYWARARRAAPTAEEQEAQRALRDELRRRLDLGLLPEDPEALTGLGLIKDIEPERRGAQRGGPARPPGRRAPVRDRDRVDPGDAMTATPAELERVFQGLAVLPSRLGGPDLSALPLDGLELVFDDRAVRIAAKIAGALEAEIGVVPGAAGTAAALRTRLEQFQQVDSLRLAAMRRRRDLLDSAALVMRRERRAQRNLLQAIDDALGLRRGPVEHTALESDAGCLLEWRDQRRQRAAQSKLEAAAARAAQAETVAAAQKQSRLAQAVHDLSRGQEIDPETEAELLDAIAARSKADAASP